MKKLVGYVMCACLMVTGCTHTQPDTGLATPVQAPPLPATLAQRPGPLPDTNIRNAADLVLEYGNSIQAYNKVAHQANNLITLYDCVREAINNETDPEKCLDVN